MIGIEPQRKAFSDLHTLPISHGKEGWVLLCKSRKALGWSWIADFFLMCLKNYEYIVVYLFSILFCFFFCLLFVLALTLSDQHILNTVRNEIVYLQSSLFTCT